MICSLQSRHLKKEKLWRGYVKKKRLTTQTYIKLFDLYEDGYSIESALRKLDIDFSSRQLAMDYYILQLCIKVKKIMVERFSVNKNWESTNFCAFPIFLPRSHNGIGCRWHSF